VIHSAWPVKAFHGNSTRAVAIGKRVGLDGDAPARAIRLIAKVLSASVQDGFDLYHHGVS